MKFVGCFIWCIDCCYVVVLDVVLVLCGWFY